MFVLLDNHIKCTESVFHKYTIKWIRSKKCASFEIKNYLVRLDGKTVVLYCVTSDEIVFEDYFSRGAALKCLSTILDSGLQKKTSS